MKTQVTHLGMIDSENRQQSYGARIQLDGKEVYVDLNFYTLRPDASGWAEVYEDYITHLAEHRRTVETALRRDFEKGGIVRKYIDCHLKELPSSILEKMLASAPPSLSPEERLLSLLSLKRIGLYPGDDAYAVWDYTPGWQYTDQLIVGNTDEAGKLEYVSWES